MNGEVKEGWSKLPKQIALVAWAAVAVLISTCGVAVADSKTYVVNYAPTAPIIDGMSTTDDEWGGATPGANEWSLLTFDSPDTTNNQFQAVWDDVGIYFKHEVDYANWRDAGREWDPAYEALNFFFDPNTDGETNEDSAAFPFTSIDGYQLAVNQPLGTSGIDASEASAGLDASAYINATFGDSAGSFSGFANVVVGQTTSVETSTGYFEMFIPWSDFDAADPAANPADTGLYHPQAPENGDQWFFNLARTQSNFTVPAWSSPAAAQFAANRPHGVLEFSRQTNPCDVDGNEVCDAADIDMIAQAVLEGSLDTRFDFNEDSFINDADRVHYVEEVLNTYLGDANLDGQFGTRDFVAVFGVGGYEDGIVGNATWATGDWNGDFDFDTRDFVAAFISGGFEAGPREPLAAVAAVPEPTAWILLLTGLLVTSLRRSK